jgi:hypothetical protein
MTSSSRVDAIRSTQTATVPRAILTIAAVIALLLLTPQHDFVPIWDGWA